MKIAEITERLKAHGVNVSEKELDAFLTRSNLTADDISDDTAVAAIAEDLKRPTSSALAAAPKTGKVSKTDKRSTRGDRGKASATSLNTAMTAAAQSTAVELDAFVGVVESSVGQYEESTAQRLVDRIREAPVNVIQRVGELAAQEVADPEAFRDAGRALFAGTCFDFNPDAA